MWKEVWSLGFNAKKNAKYHWTDQIKSDETATKEDAKRQDSEMRQRRWEGLPRGFRELSYAGDETSSNGSN